MSDEEIRGEGAIATPQVPQETRGGWQLNEIMGITPAREEELFQEITKALDALPDEDTTGGKLGLEQVVKVVSGFSIDEAVTVLMFYGRWLGHIEYEQRRRVTASSLEDLLAKAGGDAKVMVVGPDGAKMVSLSDLAKKGGE